MRKIINLASGKITRAADQVNAPVSEEVPKLRAADLADELVGKGVMTAGELEALKAKRKGK
jgi:hypothetical protein